MNARNHWMMLMLLMFIMTSALAQNKTINGIVTDAEGMPLPGVNVLIKDTTVGTQTDFDGNYTINAEPGQTLVFSYVGQMTVERIVGSSNTINVQMEEDTQALDEVVVTALGISREKKTLGYATQKVDGEAVSKVQSQNFVNSLSGKVAGLDIKASGTLGGSTNVVIRGNSSISGNNQALFVIDGVPVNNDTPNSAFQAAGAGGYDYGNAASDINPDDIESINVLKGAAASALYGSRAANGVIMITTKKGRKNKGIGITINSSLMLSSADKETLPVYQKKYGAGYGPYYAGPGGYFGLYDVDGDGNDDLTTVFTEDASFGAAFDPSLMVYQWNSAFPDLDTYRQATPWVAGANDPNYVWQTGTTAVNSVSLDGGTEKSSFRLGYTNMMQEGNLPNSHIKRNSINFNGSHDFTDKLTVSTLFNFTKTDGKGRYGTGYDSNNVMQQFRQWWQTNVDVAEQERTYHLTGLNTTWNIYAWDDTAPIYSDNPYWTFFENYETDTRNRFYGNVVLNYDLTDWLSVMGRFTFDSYSELQEERTNVGSSNIPKYVRRSRDVAEYNYDLMFNVNKELNDQLDFSGTLGFNLRRNDLTDLRASTSDGLLIPSIYNLSNSVGPITTLWPNGVNADYESTKMVDGVYLQASLGYNDFAYLEGTYRRDRSSSLPKDNNTYNYWSVTGSLLFSEIVEANWLPYGKLRANYGKVGNDTDPYNVYNTFDIVNPPFNGGALSNNGVLKNPNLLPEEQENWELGLEMQFINRRAGFDVSYYNAKNINQITAIPLSNSTGYFSSILNAGTIENKGWELQLNATPLKSSDFSWDINLNWAKNESLVVELLNGIDNLVLGAFQGGVSINATPGQPYGTIRGTDLVYHEDNGQPIVGTNGYYLTSDNSNEVIGDINPDWTAGIFNSFNYKNFNFSFLIDIQKGGDLFSLDTWYGYATGLYDFTAGTNDLGNPVRDPVADGGGVILPGVKQDGSPNDVRAFAGYYANPWGYARAANKQHIYDAGFVKLREASLTYNFDEKTMAKTPFTNASISIIGRNLWIIEKNVPYADPEAGLGAGNAQGYHSGVYPAIKEIGANLKLQF